jgi:hypothetical protein
MKCLSYIAPAYNQESGIKSSLTSKDHMQCLPMTNIAVIARFPTDPALESKNDK